MINIDNLDVEDVMGIGTTYAIYNTRRFNTPSEGEISGELPDIKG